MTTHPRPTDVTLRALTWNVGRLLPHPRIHKTATQRIFKKKLAGLSAHAHDSHLPHIARVVSHLDPDIVTLQEIGSREQLERLLGQLGHTYTASISDDIETYDRYVVILTKNGLAAYTHPIKTTSGRIALAAHLPDHDLVFVGLHVDAIRHERRSMQITEILRWLEGNTRRRVVLAGDFNLDLHIVGPRARKANLGVYRTITDGYNLLDTALAQGNTTSYLPRRLDYMFTNIEPGHIVGSRVLRWQRKGSMDHHPVVVDFRFG